MTNEERRKAAEWFRNRAKNCPMQGARRMYEIATEALEERERNEQHGRLIDADALSEKMVICAKNIPKDSFEWDMCGEVITQVALAPTIIPAEEGE